MTPFYFLTNSLSDPSFEDYLEDIRRLHDYREVKEHLLPQLIDSIEHFRGGVDTRFICNNRFENQHPALRIQSPSGFVPDVISIEFPPVHDSYVVKQGGQSLKLQGLDELSHHLRVLLVMGLAHWYPK